MKLIREFTDISNFEVLKEEIEENGQKKEVVRLKGPFMEAEIRNKNNRVYPKPILEREVKKYNDEKIAKNRAVGTCDHEDTPQVSLDRISHVIESLVMEGNKAMGVARVIDTPTGRILKTLVKEGIILGFSSRGIGELAEDGTVKDTFSLVSLDAVLDNSSPNCCVEGIVENKEYIMQGDQIVEVAVQNLKKEVDKKFSGKDLSECARNYLLKFIRDIDKNK